MIGSAVSLTSNWSFTERSEVPCIPYVESVKVLGKGVLNP